MTVVDPGLLQLPEKAARFMKANAKLAEDSPGELVRIIKGFHDFFWLYLGVVNIQLWPRSSFQCREDKIMMMITYKSMLYNYSCIII